MKVAIYCRLSAEDRNKLSVDDDSASIQNQKDMLIKHAISNGWEIFSIYSDDDYSGADRNRPEFNRLIQDAKSRKFDTVLCKSQSRFTREVELVEQYIHTLFPTLGIRFISLVDNADTEDRGNKKSRQINALVNEWFLEELSDSIKSVLTSRREQGLHIGSFAPYGYAKDPNAKGHLIIDDEAAAVVRRIYSLYLAGKGKQAIARILNEEGIPNPTEYKRLHGMVRNKNMKCSPLWSYFTITNILTNEVYIGNMIQGKSGVESYKTQQKVTYPAEQWIVVTGTHDPIIDQETWSKTQDLIQRKATHSCNRIEHARGGMHMKKRIIICLVALVLILAVGLIAWPAGNNITEETTTPSSCQTDPAETETWQEDQVPGSDIAQTTPTQNESGNDLEQPDQTDPLESTGEPDSTQPTQSKNPMPMPTWPKETEPKPTTQKPTAAKPTEPPKAPTPAETKPAETVPPETEATEPTEKIEELTPPITAPTETEPEETVPETTEPAAPEITYEFKRQVASYAAQYINQYRGSACTILPGMSQVAQYRAGQLTRNYGHSTADKRAALARFEYGRYIDATEFGDDPSNSYWEADSAEAICAGFYGTDPKAMGKKIADLIRNSSGHWSYISSSEYSYMGVGVEYREGTEYGWYACVMVGSVNYG